MWCRRETHTDFFPINFQAKLIPSATHSKTNKPSTCNSVIGKNRAGDTLPLSFAQVCDAIKQFKVEIGSRQKVD